MRERGLEKRWRSQNIKHGFTDQMSRKQPGGGNERLHNNSLRGTLEHRSRDDWTGINITRLEAAARRVFFF